MRALILSDVHANLAALEAVLADADRRDGFDVIWCLGDLVDYGPDPGPCLDLLRRYPLLAVAGNHDHAVLNRLDISDFNPAAAASAIWTARQLSAADVALLSGLPLVAIAEPFTLVHGSLRAPLREYLLTPDAAANTLARLTTPYCLVGHSHLPFLCLENRNGPEFVAFAEGQTYRLDQRRWIINPGSVGQPRDHDPRASYAIYSGAAAGAPGTPETVGTVERRRVAYDIAATQEKMRRAGLPRSLIDRLDYGV